MNIDRKIKQGDEQEALLRIRFCLDRIEESKVKFENLAKIRPIEHLSMEEIIGAMVSAEQALEEVQEQ